MQQQRTIFISDCDAQPKVDFIQQLEMTSSMIGQRSSKPLPKAKLAPKNGHGLCLVVCCWSDPLQLSESWWNHYIWEVCSANQWEAWKTAMHAIGTSQQTRAQFFSRTVPDCTSHNQHFRSWTNWTMKLCLIHHIHLTSRQWITISSSISMTFCRENPSTTSRRHKMLSKSSLNPETWIFGATEVNLFLIGKNVLNCYGSYFD